MIGTKFILVPMLALIAVSKVMLLITNTDFSVHFLL